jgi:hypothetical protein
MTANKTELSLAAKSVLTTSPLVAVIALFFPEPLRPDSGRLVDRSANETASRRSFPD